MRELSTVKAALEAGLVSQAEYDAMKRKFLALQATLQQRKADADLRAFVLESIVKHGSSIMSEDQKVDLVRDYVKMSGLDGSAEKYARASKRQRASAEKRDASPPQPLTPPAPAAAPAPVVANQARAPAPRHSKRFRSMSDLVIEKEAAAAASEDGNSSDDDGEDDSHSDEPRTGKRWKRWTEEDDAVLVAALRAGQKVTTIKIGGRSEKASERRLDNARERGLGSPALREYLDETYPQNVYKPPSERRVHKGWSAEEDQTFIQAHKKGKTQREIAAMLPGRTEGAVRERWRHAKLGKRSSAALLAYAAEYRKNKQRSVSKKQ